MNPTIEAFFDEATFTVTYVVSDPATAKTAIIDPVLDFDPKSGRTTTASADKVIAHVRDNGLDVDWILETHVHADHLSAAPYIKHEVGGQIGIGDQVPTVQGIFKKVFNEDDSFAIDGSDFDALFAAGDSIHLGNVSGEVLHTPGHTPGSTCYAISTEQGENTLLFSGDTLFPGGPGRSGSPELFLQEVQSITGRLFPLPDKTAVMPGHGDDTTIGTAKHEYGIFASKQHADDLHGNVAWLED